MHTLWQQTSKDEDEKTSKDEDEKTTKDEDEKTTRTTTTKQTILMQYILHKTAKKKWQTY